MQRMEQFTKQQLDEPSLPPYPSTSSTSSSSTSSSSPMSMGMMRMPGGKRGRKLPPDIDSFLGPLSPNRMGGGGSGSNESLERPLGIDDLAFITITPEAVGSNEVCSFSSSSSSSSYPLSSFYFSSALKSLLSSAPSWYICFPSPPSHFSHSFVFRVQQQRMSDDGRTSIL